MSMSYPPPPPNNDSAVAYPAWTTSHRVWSASTVPTSVTATFSRDYWVNMQSVSPSPSPSPYPADPADAQQSSDQTVVKNGVQPHIIGISVSFILVVVASICLGVWYCMRRRHRKTRVEARGMREIGREDGAGHFASLGAHGLAPPNRDSGRWEDDSEADMVANDGSTLARTLSTRSTSTIRASTIIDHPGYTYHSSSHNQSRSNGTYTFGMVSPVSAVRTAATQHLLPSNSASPFSDTYQSRDRSEPSDGTSPLGTSPLANSSSTHVTVPSRAASVSHLSISGESIVTNATLPQYSVSPFSDPDPFEDPQPPPYVRS